MSVERPDLASLRPGWLGTDLYPQSFQSVEVLRTYALAQEQHAETLAAENAQMKLRIAEADLILSQDILHHRHAPAMDRAYSSLCSACTVLLARSALAANPQASDAERR